MPEHGPSRGEGRPFPSRVGGSVGPGRISEEKEVMVHRDWAAGRAGGCTEECDPSESGVNRGFISGQWGLIVRVECEVRCRLLNWGLNGERGEARGERVVMNALR